MAFKQIGYPITSNHDTAKLEPGTVWQDGATGKVYRYVLIEDADVANGDVVEYSDTSGYEVTKDRSGGASIGRVVAGVAVATVSDGNYGFIQVSGRHTSVKTDGGVSAGDPLIPHATYDGKADTAAAGSTVTNTEGQRFAFALANDDTSASTARVVADIRCL
jgi:hypothetical protein